MPKDHTCRKKWADVEDTGSCRLIGNKKVECKLSRRTNVGDVFLMHQRGHLI